MTVAAVGVTLALIVLVIARLVWVEGSETRDAYRRSHLAFYEKHHPWFAPILRLYRRFR